MGYQGGTAVTDLAAGKWSGILLRLGVDQKVVGGKHQPCPFCGGVDRFRFTNHLGKGGWICSQCRPDGDDGFAFLKEWKGWDFKTAAKAVRDVLGYVDTRDEAPAAIDPKRRRSMLNDLWRPGIPIADSQHALDYFASRGIKETDFTQDLRYNPSAIMGPGESAPCIVALVRDLDGRPVTIHRTFLKPDRAEKHDDNPRRLMPGGVPDGAHVRLLGGDSPTVLGIAEGIETAYAASILFNVPVWACLNTAFMKKFVPPSTVEDFVVFADNDRHFAGQVAAYTVANRVSVMPAFSDTAVSVKVPDTAGTDWNDLLAV